jgi:adenylate cyclase
VILNFPISGGSCSDLAFISKILQSGRLRVCGLILIAFAILVALRAFHLGQVLDNQALDLCYRLRPFSSPPSEILIVGIDEHSFQDLKKAWPWPRSYHAKLVRQLKAAGARLIVFDVLFAEPSNPKDDQALADAMREAGNVILATTIESSESTHVARQILVQPYQLFRQAALGMGLTLVTPDGDGIVRRFHCHLGDEETLPETVAHAYLPNLVIPPHLCSLIHFTGPPGHLYTISYSRVLEGLDPDVAASVRGKIVLIGRIVGAAPTPIADSFYTPFFAATGQLMSGVEIHGQVIHTLLKRNWGQELPVLSRLGLDLLVLLLFGMLLVRISPFAAMGVLVGFILAIFGLSAYLFLHLNLWWPPVLLSGGLAVVYAGYIFAHYWIESREKRWLRQAFGQYVSESLVESIIAHPERLQLGGEEVEATVLFSDLVGFTSMAENTAPKELIRLLNEYFSTMTEIILAHKGTVDKFIGDAIMAFWGAPLPIADHASLACETALEMVAAMRVLQKSWKTQGFPAISLRIGLHTGPVVAGNVGSKKHFNYTVMGDTVNLAARLERANKVYGTEIMMSDTTYRRLGNTFLVRELDLVQVHGRAQPVMVYELLGFMPPTGPPGWLSIFEVGRAAYLQGKIPEAASRFFEILDLYCDDPPSSVYLKRCQKHLDKPSLSEWTGAHILDNK